MLSQRSLNLVQSWALYYWVLMTRRTEIEDKLAELEHQTFNLFPERYDQLYRDTPPSPEGESVSEVADLDIWFEGLANQRGMTGQEAREVMGDADRWLA